MGREFNRLVVAILKPPLRVLGFVVSSAYSALFGWYDKRLAKREQELLEREVQDQLSFLLVERNARILAAKKVKHLSDIDWPIATVVVEGLLVQFRRWRGELQVHVAPERMPNDWQELSLVLSVIDVPGGFDLRSVYWMSDVALWLRVHLDRILAAFSEERYLETKQRLDDVHARDGIAIKQWETEVNRRLYR